MAAPAKRRRLGEQQQQQQCGVPLQPPPRRSAASEAHRCLASALPRAAAALRSGSTAGAVAAALTPTLRAAAAAGGVDCVHAILFHWAVVLPQIPSLRDTVPLPLAGAADGEQLAAVYLACISTLGWWTAGAGCLLALQPPPPQPGPPAPCLEAGDWAEVIDAAPRPPPAPPPPAECAAGRRALRRAAGALPAAAGAAAANWRRTLEALDGEAPGAPGAAPRGPSSSAESAAAAAAEALARAPAPGQHAGGSSGAEGQQGQDVDAFCEAVAAGAAAGPWAALYGGGSAEGLRYQLARGGLPFVRPGEAVGEAALRSAENGAPTDRAERGALLGLLFAPEVVGAAYAAGAHLDTLWGLAAGAPLLAATFAFRAAADPGLPSGTRADLAGRACALLQQAAATDGDAAAPTAAELRGGRDAAAAALRQWPQGLPAAGGCAPAGAGPAALLNHLTPERLRDGSFLLRALACFLSSPRRLLSCCVAAARGSPLALPSLAALLRWLGPLAAAAADAPEQGSLPVLAARGALPPQLTAALLSSGALGYEAVVASGGDDALPPGVQLAVLQALVAPGDLPQAVPWLPTAADEAGLPPPPCRPPLGVRGTLAARCRRLSQQRWLLFGPPQAQQVARLAAAAEALLGAPGSRPRWLPSAEDCPAPSGPAAVVWRCVGRLLRGADLALAADSSDAESDDDSWGSAGEESSSEGGEALTEREGGGAEDSAYGCGSRLRTLAVSLCVTVPWLGDAERGRLCGGPLLRLAAAAVPYADVVAAACALARAVLCAAAPGVYREVYSPQLLWWLPTHAGADEELPGPPAAATVVAALCETLITALRRSQCTQRQQQPAAAGDPGELPPPAEAAAAAFRHLCCTVQRADPGSAAREQLLLTLRPLAETAASVAGHAAAEVATHLRQCVASLRNMLTEELAGSQQLLDRELALLGAVEGSLPPPDAEGDRAATAAEPSPARSSSGSDRSASAAAQVPVAREGAARC
eukprot:TRINITY_DN3144_c2_g1_i2.p1 TRINITY_DN3144_c2_g1~~TRINITY_DN3144_c2_g1_i2.p1  ORF type:complete len:1014 (+),score=240.47 TRINITY_DN3144_c2_g1_i2:83-3043(+)